MSLDQNQSSFQIDSFDDLTMTSNQKLHYNSQPPFQSPFSPFENTKWLLRTIKSLCNYCNQPYRYDEIKSELKRRGFIKKPKEYEYAKSSDILKDNSKDNNESYQVMVNKSPFPQVYSTLDVISDNDISAVLKIQNLIDKQIYALKILKVSVSEIPYAMHEIQTLAHLTSPRLIRYFSSWVEENPNSQFLSFYIQTEFFEGSYTLQDYLQNRRDNQDSYKKVYHKILYELATALQEIHQAKIVHRDIQPSNIILRDNFSIVVIGFSISSPIYKRKHYNSLTPPVSAINSNSKNNLHESSSSSLKIAPLDVLCINAAENAANFPARRLGSQTYASPQQLNGRKSTPSDDIYSFGIIMFELLANIEGDRKRINAIRQLRNFATLPDNFDIEFKEESELILKMTSHDPSKRPSAEEVLQTNLFKKWKNEEA